MQDNILKYHSKLRHYALKLTKNNDDAKDLVQDTILRALENSDKFDGVNFIGWATTIMTNIYYNSKKKGRVKLTQLFDHGQYSIDKTLDARIDIREINKVMDRMDVNKVRILMLKYEGYCYDEISKMENKKVGTLKSGIFRTILKFRKEFNEYDNK